MVVSESGIKTQDDMRYLKIWACAVLIGETFMRADSINENKNLNW